MANTHVNTGMTDERAIDIKFSPNPTPFTPAPRPVKKNKTTWADHLDSRWFQLTIMILTLVEMAIVFTDIGLTLHFRTSCPPIDVPSGLDEAIEVLSWTSYGILCIFVVETLFSLAVKRAKMFTNFGDVSDMIIVITSFTLDTLSRTYFLSHELSQLAEVLLFVRLWHVVRVVHGVSHQVKHKYETEIHELKDRIVRLELQLLSNKTQKIVDDTRPRGYGNKI
jgi:hypothetical protein